MYRKSILIVLIALAFAVFSIGLVCAAGDEASSPTAPAAGNAQKYSRLAFVCAPKTGADPDYVSMVLKEIEKTAPKYLAYLPKVKIIPDASIDTSTATPTVRFKNINDYDAVAVIIYSYSGPKLLMDITMIDAHTGQKIWGHQLHGKSSNIKHLTKLTRHALKRINKEFYR